MQLTGRQLFQLKGVSSQTQALPSAGDLDHFRRKTPDLAVILNNDPVAAGYNQLRYIRQRFCRNVKECRSFLQSLSHSHTSAERIYAHEGRFKPI